MAFSVSSVDELIAKIGKAAGTVRRRSTTTGSAVVVYDGSFTAEIDFFESSFGTPSTDAPIFDCVGAFSEADVVAKAVVGRGGAIGDLAAALAAGALTLSEARALANSVGESSSPAVEVNVFANDTVVSALLACVCRDVVVNAIGDELCVVTLPVQSLELCASLLARAGFRHSPPRSSIGRQFLPVDRANLVRLADKGLAFGNAGLSSLLQTLGARTAIVIGGETVGDSKVVRDGYESVSLLACGTQRMLAHGICASFVAGTPFVVPRYMATSGVLPRLPSTPLNSSYIPFFPTDTHASTYALTWTPMELPAMKSVDGTLVRFVENGSLPDDGLCVLRGEEFGVAQDRIYTVDPMDGAQFGRLCEHLGEDLLVSLEWELTAIEALEVATTIATHSAVRGLAIVSRMAEVLVGDEPGSIQDRPPAIGVLASSFATEIPSKRFVAIDVDGSLPVERVVLCELADVANEQRVAYRRGCRFVLRLDEHHFSAFTHIDAHTVDAVVISGGLGGLGLSLCSHLLKRGRSLKFILLSRRGDDAELTDPLREAFPDATILGISVNVADEGALEQALETSLRGSAGGDVDIDFYHLAGSFQRGLAGTFSTSSSGVVDTLAAKIDGTLSAHTVFAKFDWLSVENFVCFSSVAAVAPTPGQCVYGTFSHFFFFFFCVCVCFCVLYVSHICLLISHRLHVVTVGLANASMDAIVRARRLNGLAATTIQWGPFGDVGILASLDSGAFLGSSGLRTHSSDVAFSVLDSIMHSGGDAFVADVDWRLFRESNGGGAMVEALTARGLGSGTPTNLATQPSTMLQSSFMSPSLSQSIMNIAQRVAGSLSFDEVKVMVVDVVDAFVDVHSGLTFAEMGIDSLLGVQVRNELAAVFGLPLPATLLLNAQSFDEVADFIHSAIDRREVPGVPVEDDVDSERVFGSFTTLEAMSSIRTTLARRKELPREVVADVLAELQMTLLPEQYASYPMPPNAVPLYSAYASNPDSHEYNVSFAVELPASLSASVISGALAVLSGRHEMLRATFTASAEDGFMYAIKPGRIPFAVRFATCEETEGLLEDLRSEPFDLSVCCFRACLVRRKGFSSVLLLCGHHCAVDGASMAILVQELSQVITKRPLPEVSSTYAEFATSTRDSSAVDSDWSSYLSGANFHLGLLRSEVRSADEDSVFFEFTPEEIEAIRLSCVGVQVRPFTMALTRWMDVLKAFSNNTDVVVGVQSHGRNNAPDWQVIGNYVALLPIRSPPPDMTISEFEDLVWKEPLFPQLHQRLTLLITERRFVPPLTS